MFENKHIVVGVCGGIAAYKAAGLVSHLRQAGADVHCIMTANAAKLVTPITFGELSGNDVTVDMFANIYKWDVEHIALARLADSDPPAAWTMVRAMDRPRPMPSVVRLVRAPR